MATKTDKETPSDKAVMEPMLVNIKSSEDKEGEEEEEEQQLAKKARKDCTCCLVCGTQPCCQ